MSALDEIRKANPSAAPSGGSALSAMRQANADRGLSGYQGYAQTQEYRNAQYVNQAAEDQLKWYHKTYSKTAGEFDNFVDAFAEGMLQTPRVEDKSFNPITANQRGTEMAVDTYVEALDDMGSRWDRLLEAYSKDGFWAGVNPFHNRLEKESAALGVGVGAVNVFAAPIMSATTYASAYPGIGHIADGTNAVFMGAMSGIGQVASDALQALPVSDKTKETLDQPVRELTGLATTLGLGAFFVPKSAPPVRTRNLEVQSDTSTYPVEIERTNYEAYAAPEDMPVIDYGETVRKTNPEELVEFVPEAAAPDNSGLPVIEAGDMARVRELITEIKETIKNDPDVVTELDSLQRSLEGEIAAQQTGGRLGALRRYADFDRAESEVFTQLQNAEAGRRIVRDDGTVVAEPSTFPDFLPEEVRSREIIDKAIELIETNREPRANATRQRTAVDAIVTEIESRIDTSKPEAVVEMADMPGVGEGVSEVGVAPRQPRAEEVPGAPEGAIPDTTDILSPLSGTGERVVPRMTERMSEIAGAIDPAMSEIMVGNTRRRINLKIQAEMAAKLVETDASRALDISFGRRQPPKAGEFGPEPMTEAIVREAMVQKAMKDGDIQTLFDLSTLENPRAMAEVRHGQEIASLRGRDSANNPTVIAKDVRTERMAMYEKDKGKNAFAEIEKVSDSLNEVATSRLKDKKAVDDFLKGLEC